MKKLSILFACIVFTACSTPKPNLNQANPATDNKPDVAAVAPSPQVNTAETEEAMRVAKEAEAVRVANEAAVAEAARAVAAREAEATAKAAAAAHQAHSLEIESVYFDYDQFAVKPEYFDLLKKEAEILRSHPHVAVTLAGNADERGSSEYNLALGEKRSAAVRKSLEMLGIHAAQIKVISYGDMKPKLKCHEEKCWKENRRVDFVQAHD